MRIQQMTIAAAGLITALGATRAPIAQADTLHDGKVAFENVQIVGLFDHELRFLTQDRRTLSRPAAGVRYIILSDSASEVAKALTDAEQAADRGKAQEAAALYAKVRATDKTDWMGRFATMRVAKLFDRPAGFREAFEAWLALTSNSPNLAKAVTPTKLPTAGTKAGQEALALIAAAEKNKRPADVAAALANMRRQIEGGRPAGSGGPLPREGGGRTQTGGSKPAIKGTEAIGSVRSAIAAGDLDRAGQLVAAGKAGARKADVPQWLLAEAELELARKAYDRAGLAAMRVVVLYPESAQVGEALLMAGRAYEGLGRPSEAIELYEECRKSRRAGAATVGEAEARLSALRKAEPTP